MYLQIMFNIYLYKQDLVLNNPQWLTCHKTQPNKNNVLLLKSIQFTSLGFLFVTISRSSHVQFPSFFAWSIRFLTILKNFFFVLAFLFVLDLFILLLLLLATVINLF